MTNPLLDDPRVAKIFEADAALTAPGMLYEVVDDDVLGERMPVFRNRHANLRDQLLAGAAKYGDGDLYIWSDGRRQTFSGLVPEVAEVAAGLRDRYGVTKGDRVAICSANNPEWILTFWACASLGAVLVAMNGWWTGAEMRNAIDLTEPTVLIMDEKRAARLDGTDLSGFGVTTIVIERDWDGVPVAGVTELPDVPLHEDDPFELLFTSGTTGRPKAAILSHRAVIAYIQFQPYGVTRAMWMAGVKPEDGVTPRNPVRLAVYPLFHVSGLSTIVGGVEQGAKSVWMLGRFDPAQVIEMTKQEGINMWGGGTTHVMRLLEHPDATTVDPAQIWSVNVGGSATPPAVIDKIEEMFPHLTGSTGSGYGATEAGLISHSTHWMLRAAPDCAGSIYPTVQMRITDELGEVLPDGESGYVEVRSAQNMPSYWNNPEATADAVMPGRWLRTGDFGRLEGGLLFISTRMRDLIIRGGENIYPFEVENRLDEHPEVIECAVFGVDSAMYGQEVKAVVIVRDGAEVDPEELRAFCATELASYKVPTEIELRNEPLPRTASGKIMKHVLAGAANTQIEEVTGMAEDVYYDPYNYEIDCDPYPTWRRLRDEAPVYYNEKFDFWALSRYDDVLEGLLDSETYSSAHGSQLNMLQPEPYDIPMMIMKDPPEHTRLRKLVSRAFTPKRISELETKVAELSNEFLDGFEGKSEFDYIAGFAGLLPPTVILSLIGYPEGHAAEFRALADKTLHVEEAEDAAGAQVSQANIAGDGAMSASAFAIIPDLVQERLDDPQDDLISDLVRSEITEEDGTTRKLTMSEIVGFVQLLGLAGTETVARLLGFAAVTLARNPDQRKLLVDDHSLLVNGVEELLRYEAPSPVQARWVKRDVEIHGVTIPANSKMGLLNASANRDERHFPDPDRFDVQRDIDRHLTLGYGTHFCIGAAVARLETRVALRETLKRFPEWGIDESRVEHVHTASVRGYSSVVMQV